MPLVIGPLSAPTPAPVNTSVPPEMPPDKASAPASELMSVTVPALKVMLPATELEPLKFTRAPFCPAAPAPERVSASAPSAKPPCNCREAPGAMVVPAAVPPRASPF